ncbi:MAG: hypothetical protein K2H85_08960, partial [Allobaculum sp.]|nr:hypothetical protein [Allobaculum sp.]
KVALLRLFYSDLKESSNVEKYRNYLSDHLNDPLAVNKLSDYIVVDLFNQGFIPTEKGLEGLMNQALKPKLDSDPLFATRLNLIYGFYLNGVLTDLSPLKELADKNPFLDFLLAPAKFNFSKVDFSNSLWKMVIDHPKYIKYFIAHKNEILANLEHKSKDRKLKEWEQNLYYGLLFSRETSINF